MTSSHRQPIPESWAKHSKAFVMLLRTKRKFALWNREAILCIEKSTAANS